ncbi:PIG-L deacetylase family protein [Sphingomonas sp.]|jgi:LmbE family N-acetylglucosaminyl deacetylase|uniref:PIG-L deacetylase family protein n=1 Tax=Sphingomonas sp. TaxID=28214 RepID=UPI002EDB2BD4
MSIRRALIVAPHADDEAIGAWGLMDLLRRRRTRLWVIVVSDGAASHPGSRTWPPSRLVAERRRETRRAMRSLDISPSCIRFLDLPDGTLDAPITRRRLRRELLRMPKPDLLVGPVNDDAHADHRAVASAFHRCPGVYLGYRVWPAMKSRAGRVRIPLDIRTRAMKRRVVCSYRTQSGLITDSPTGMTITARHLAAFVRPTEDFQVGS